MFFADFQAELRDAAQEVNPVRAMLFAIGISALLGAATPRSITAMPASAVSPVMVLAQANPQSAPEAAPATSPQSTPSASPQTTPPKDVNVDISVQHSGSHFYANPVWLAIGAIAVVVLVLIIAVAVRGGSGTGGTTIVKD